MLPGQRFFSRPVIPLLAFFMAGIAAGSAIPGYGTWFYPAAGLCTAFAFFSYRKTKPAYLSVACLFLILGYLSLQPWSAPRFPTRHIVRYADSGKCLITGRVESAPIKGNNRLQFIIEVESLEREKKQEPVCGKARVTVLSVEPEIFFGDRIRINGRVRFFRNFNNPGGFDYRRYMAHQGIWVSMYGSAEDVVILEKSSRKGIRLWIENARVAVSNLILRTGHGEAQEVLKALIMGDCSGIPDKTRDAFNRAGLAHMLSISGQHVGIVATVAFVGFSWILSWIPALLWRAWTRKAAAVLSLFPVIFYGLLAGMPPATQRAVIMATVFLLTFLLERDHDSINTLAAAALAILVVHPPFLFSISFQLSFMAVFSIVYGMSRFPARRTETAFLRKAVDLVQLTLFAVLGTLPMVMYYFNQIAIVGAVSNFFLVPLIGFGVIPLGLLAVFLYPLSGQAAFWCMSGSAAVLEKSLSLVYIFSDFPLAAVKTVTPSWVEIVCYYLMAWGILGLFKKKESDARRHSGKLAAAAVLVALLLGAADVYYWIETRFRHEDLRVTVLDVGQGSASLLEFPGGDCMLIDGGGFSDHLSFDVGEKVVAPFLWRKKIRTLDTVILSHPDSDHLNGLVYIVENFYVRQVWTTGEASESQSYQRFVDIIRDRGIRCPDFCEIPKTGEIKGVKLEILYPPTDFLFRKKTETWRNRNNCSMTIKASFGSQSFLFPGDLMAEGENELVRMWKTALKSSVLVAPHHGSNTSSTRELIERVDAEVIVVSSGRKASKADEAVMERYRRRPCRIYRTFSQGAICMSTGGSSLRIAQTVPDGCLPPSSLTEE